MQKKSERKKLNTITFCSSVSFYPKLIEIEKELALRGFAIILPEGAEKMKTDSSFSAQAYKDRYMQDKDVNTKARLITAHFEKIAKADAILVVNLEKHGQKGYIGGNVLMEMGLAFYLKKKIFLYEPINESLSFADEIDGMQPIVISGDTSLVAF